MKVGASCTYACSFVALPSERFMLLKVGASCTCAGTFVALPSERSTLLKVDTGWSFFGLLSVSAFQNRRGAADVASLVGA
jgi:hypothetical protein